MLVALPVLIAAANSPNSYGFIPATIRSSVAYRYEANDSESTNQSRSVHAIATITRIAQDEISVDFRQDGVPTAAFTAMIGDDGSLQSFAPTVSRGQAGSPSASPSARPRARNPVATITDSPAPQARRLAPTIPEPISETAALLAAAAAEGSYPRTWTHALSSETVPFVLSLSRTDNGTSTTFVADGGGSGNLIHIESTVRDGKFAGAHGTLRIVTSNMDQTQTTTTIWSLSPVSSS